MAAWSHCTSLLLLLLLPPGPLLLCLLASFRLFKELGETLTSEVRD